MTLKDNDKEEQAAASSPADETPTLGEEGYWDWYPMSTDEVQRLYVNLRVRLRSLAYAIQQTQQIDGEMDEAYCAREELERRQADGLTVEEERHLARLGAGNFNKWILRGAWHVAVTSLLLALVPKDWAEQGKPTGDWLRADGAVELDPDQELDFEEQIPRDFMPSWSREALEEFLAQFDPRQRRKWMLDDGWTIGFGPVTGEYFRAPDLPRIESIVAPPRRRTAADTERRHTLGECMLEKRGSP